MYTSDLFDTVCTDVQSPHATGQELNLRHNKASCWLITHCVFNERCNVERKHKVVSMHKTCIEEHQTNMQLEHFSICNLKPHTKMQVQEARNLETSGTSLHISAAGTFTAFLRRAVISLFVSHKKILTVIILSFFVKIKVMFFINQALKFNNPSSKQNPQG